MLAWTSSAGTDNANSIDRSRGGPTTKDAVQLGTFGHLFWRAEQMIELSEKP